ncbi:MAG: sigma 54-interacting transcriptional regulator [Deltaproteobacteria bacterium]|nr:sigma 54-interacting transcriptional regulator [Deltaproteobacteria bacterium]
MKAAIPHNQIENLRDLLAAQESAIKWLLSILDSMNNGILIMDDAMIVRYINSEYTRITGVTHDKIIGGLLRDVRPGAILPDVVRTGKPLSGVFRREGDIAYVVDLAPITLDGRIRGGIGVFKDITEVQRLSTELKRIQKQTDRLKSLVHHAFQAKHILGDIIGVSAEIRNVIRLAERFAQSGNDILITGESGTGKEIVAQAIHNASDRAASPFVTVNCAALSPTLLESELFGYIEGAFTGARKGGKIGMLEIAEGGTIFLDEIAELTAQMQARFLRVLQERTIRRIGDTQEIPLDIRVIAATNKHIGRMADEGRFRFDLYYRLHVLNIHMPSLRDRLVDTRVLADHFLKECRQKLMRDLHFDPAVYDAFVKHNWPGNVRELIHTVEFAAQISEDPVIGVQHLPKILNPGPEPECLKRGTLAELVKNFERMVILGRLKSHGSSIHHKIKVARELGISKATLYNKIKSLGIGTGSLNN